MCRSEAQLPAQAGRPDAVVFAIVRNKTGSIHLNAAVTGLKNVHIVEADVVDYASLEVVRCPGCLQSGMSNSRPSTQRAAKEVGATTGGKLDCLIHNAARIYGDTIYFRFND